MRVLVLFLLLVLSIPAWAAPEDSPAPGTSVLGNGIIVPGESVGPVRLGMTLHQILETVGNGYRRDEFKPEKITLYEWRAPGIWVSVDAQTRQVRVISAFGTNDKYRTDKGVGLLDPFAKAEKIYGKDYKRWGYRKEGILLIRYPALGLQFGVVDKPAQPLLHGRIFQIGIFKPGALPPVRAP